MVKNIHHISLAFTFGVLGNVISFLVYLAPLPTFYRICKKKSTEGFQSLPYLVALFSSMLWLYYALLKREDTILLITINSFGCFIEIIYIITFIIFAHKDARNLAIQLFAAMNIVAFALILFVTHFALHDPVRVRALGWICVAVSVTVFAAPLSIMKQVIRTKSVQYMPFNLSFFLTLSAVMWFGYGVFLKDICIAIPNVIGFMLGLAQMVLYGIYKKGDVKKEAEQQVSVIEAPVINIVVVNPLGTCEVFPIPMDSNGVVNNNNNNNNQQFQVKKGVAQDEKNEETTNEEELSTPD